MGRSPCCSKEGLNRGAWTAHEDKILTEYIRVHGEGRWRNLPKRAGLKRCGKSCRLRWLNYLRPDIKRGNISRDEEELIVRLHKLLGNRWSLIAGRLPGRTDNEIKNYWNTNLGKKVKENHQKTNTPSRKLPSQPHEKSSENPKTPKPSNSPSSTPSMLDPQVVRAKATKCSRAFINPLPHPHHHSSFQNKSNAETEAELAVPLLVDEAVNYINISSSNQTEPNDWGFLSFANSAGAEEEFASGSLLMDFNMGELCLSDLLNSDFSADDNLCDFS